MARFRGARFLTCFYCGKRSGLRWDGVTRDFLCLYCDATNYLDHNGEITDPPVATDREASTTQFAAPKPSSPADSIFCPTCLKNQHLFTKSLAQYFHDDPADPDYARLERNYHRYRRGLERRYPQVCDDCADKVEDRIRQAGYTAKTDHLRRMMNLSRGRKPAPTRSALDRVSTLGRGLWWLGFVLQMLWHLKTIARVLQPAGNGMRDPDADAGALAMMLASLKRATALLPAADTLVRCSIAAAFMSAWWNPHFVQVNRGFTRHLLGLTQWYSFQGLIVFFRLVSRGVLGMSGGQSQSVHAQVSAHLVMAAVMVLIYVLAAKSIRVDTSPLFATGHQSVLPREKKSPARRKKEDSKTLSELFNDALGSAGGSVQKPQQPLDPSPSPRPSLSPFRPQTNPQPSFGSLGLSDTRTPSRPSRQVQYAEEMDWSPITPQHRAFADQPSPSKGPGTLGQSPAPTESSSPFWYKVPAAPVNPARRLRNPPLAPEPKQVPLETSKVIFKGLRGEGVEGKEPSGTSAGVEFRQPTFFAPERDDASSLADLLNQSFSLSQEQDSQHTECEEDEMIPGGGQNTAKSARGLSHGARFWTARPLGPLVLVALLAAWLLTLLVAFPRRVECQMAIMATAGAVALRGTGDASADAQQDTGPGPAAYVLSALGVAELAAVCWVGSEAWKGEAPGVGLYGAGVLAAMLGHEAWRHVTA